MFLRLSSLRMASAVAAVGVVASGSTTFGLPTVPETLVKILDLEALAHHCLKDGAQAQNGTKQHTWMSVLAADDNQTSDCPGGSLQACTSYCPTRDPEVHRLCVSECVHLCGRPWPDGYSDLRDFSDAVAEYELVDATDLAAFKDELASTVAKHGMSKYMQLSLPHTHFDMEAGHLLCEEQFPHNHTSILRPVKVESSLHAIPFSFYYHEGGWRTYEYILDSHDASGVFAKLLASAVMDDFADVLIKHGFESMFGFHLSVRPHLVGSTVESPGSQPRELVVRPMHPDSPEPERPGVPEPERPGLPGFGDMSTPTPKSAGRSGLIGPEDGWIFGSHDVCNQHSITNNCNDHQKKLADKQPSAGVTSATVAWSLDQPEEGWCLSHTNTCHKHDICNSHPSK